MNIVDSHEVSIDVFGDGSDIWSAKWDGGEKVNIFRGDFVNNRIAFNHLLVLDVQKGITLKEFCEWAVPTLSALIQEATENG
jgi:hypothetical protein